MNKKYILILAVLAVAIFALGVHLATAGPVEVQIGDTTISFLPLVMTSKAADAPTGVLYVFSFPGTTEGNAGGRLAMMELCPTEDPESHFCSIEEIENAWGTTGVFFSPSFSTSWVDIYSVDYWVTDSDNCNGWTSSDPAHYGYTLNPSYISKAQSGCQVDISVACCKRIP